MSEKQPSAQIDPSWEPYLDLLTGKQAFYDVITQREYDLNNVHDAITPDKSVQIIPKYVSKIDLDHDGTEEIIVDIYTQSICYGCMVLDVQDDGTVYSYQFWLRQMRGIKEDGTFESSGSAYNVEIRSVSFENAQEVFTTIAKYDFEGDTPVFYIENRPVSSDEFDDYFDRWQARKDADYFDLSIFQDTIPT